MEILALDLFANFASILYVALGLGLVIFFHELGHFAVAKWCDVNVERFSIGFGPIIWRYKRGETEYALSAIPFGGYVKMLGQDDMDPSQMSSEEIAADPRSYSAKTVRQRMAIISAGVIMNIITAMMFFAIAFKFGYNTSPPTVGHVVTAMPAFEQGVQRGYRIKQINDREIRTFSDILRATALSSGPLNISGVDGNDQPFSLVIAPNKDDRKGDTRPRIGIAPSLSPKIWRHETMQKFVYERGRPAGNASPELQNGDLITRVNGRDIESFVDLVKAMSDFRSEEVILTVQRTAEKKSEEAKTVTVTLKPQPYRETGLRLEIGKIVAVAKGSPADKAGIRMGDKITQVIAGGQARQLATDIDPLRLPEELRKLAGEEIEIEVKREGAGGGSETITLKLTPQDKTNWLPSGIMPTEPTAADSIGVAYSVLPQVIQVIPDSPADKAGIQSNDKIESVLLTFPDDYELESQQTKEIKIEFDDKLTDWSYIHWVIQVQPLRQIKLTVSRGGEDQRTVDLAPVKSEDWFTASDRGLRLEPANRLLVADNTIEAMQMGINYTHNAALDIYLTLRSLFSGRLSAKELHGPIGIAEVAYKFSQQGLPDLCLFLGLLSVNLAVLNFLPIPVLDGGHMVFLIWEAVTRKKPNARVLMAAQVVGFVFVVSLMVFVLYLDIFVHR